MVIGALLVVGWLFLIYATNQAYASRVTAPLQIIEVYGGGLFLQGLGLVVGCLSLAALGRSLGLVPAHRGLVTSGAYSFLRHPLYASYALAGLGYLLQSPRPWNVAVLIAVWTCQVARIVSEEKLLGTDANYRAYALRTRRRLIPGVW